jgi:predicted ATP-grasp superfamily ATP-dependent carboligase
VPPTDLPKTSSPRRARPKASLLIAAVSGRALAHAAVDAGFDALVADFFADADTQGLAHACRKMPGDIARGFQWRSLAPALQALAEQAPSPLLGVIYGSGLEDRPHLLARIAERWPLLGNTVETVTRIKDPETFFATLDELAIPHPPTAMTRPKNGTGWVAKRRGGAGGSHVVPSRLQKDAANIYYQALAEGRAVSALFLGNGSEARVLGFTEQWSAPAPRRQWRYGGAVQPARLPEDAAEAMTRAVTLLAKAFGLKGLGSADFVLAENQPLLLEINPRPGATLDIFAGARKPLLKLHIDAVRGGALPRNPPVFEGAVASAIVHAPTRVIVPRSMIWPAWAADLPKPGERIDKQRPICTVLARAGTDARAKRLVETRKASLLAKIQELTRGNECERQEERTRRNT